MMRLLLLATAIAAMAQPAIGEWHILEGFEARSLAAAGSRGAPGVSVHQRCDAGPTSHIQALYAAARRLTDAAEEPAGTVEEPAGDTGTEDTGTGEATGTDDATGTDEATGTGDDGTVDAVPPVDETAEPPVGGGDTNTTAPAPATAEPAVEGDTTGTDPDVSDPGEEQDGVPIFLSCAGFDHLRRL